MFICLHIVCSCFCAIVAELSSWDRDPLACKATQNLLMALKKSLQNKNKNTVNPCSRWHSSRIPLCVLRVDSLVRVFFTQFYSKHVPLPVWVFHLEHPINATMPPPLREKSSSLSCRHFLPPAGQWDSNLWSEQANRKRWARPITFFSWEFSIGKQRGYQEKW